MSYKKLSELVHLVDIKNTDCKVTRVIGVSITKNFIPSVANLNGVDLTKYNLIKKNQFACKLMSVGRDLQLPIDLYKEDDLALISSAYYVFEVKDENEILPDYLNMWFRRKETDRWVGYISGGDVRGGISWDMFLEMDVNVPSIEKQREIVAQYQAVANKIKVNEQICEKLEATAQTLYKQWFLDFEFPNEEGKPYKSSGGAMVYNEELEKEIPEGWEVKSLREVCEKIASGSTPSGGKENYKQNGISLIRSMNVHDLEFIYEDLAFIDEKQAKKLSNVIIESGDLLFNITGVSVARCTIVPDIILPARVNQHVMIIRPKKKSALNFYLLLNITSTESKNELLGISQSGSTREAITKSDVENFKILMPNIDVLNTYNSILAKQFDLIEISRLQNQKLTQLQSLLLSRLATLEG